MNTNLKYLSLHIIGSLTYLSFPIIFSPHLSNNFDFIYGVFFQLNFYTHLLLLFSFYISYYILIPKFYFKKKYFQFILTLSLIYITIIFGKQFIFSLKNERHHHSENKEDKKNHHHHEHHKHSALMNFYLFAGKDFLSFSLAVILPLMLRTASRWKQAEQEKTNTELSFLKAQINPHFLFNSLNSIFSMSINENAERSANAIQKLSEMMRFVLEESEHEFVSLQKEINYIQNYIELQKLRFGDTIQIQFNINYHQEDISIAPLIIIPFIENAFKYGVNPEKKSVLIVDFIIENNKLCLHVKNEKLRQNFPEDEKHGIGLRNTISRLNLIYPDKHKLEIRETQSDFEVKLKLNLT